MLLRCSRGERAKGEGSVAHQLTSAIDGRHGAARAQAAAVGREPGLLSCSGDRPVVVAL